MPQGIADIFVASLPTLVMAMMLLAFRPAFGIRSYSAALRRILLVVAPIIVTISIGGLYLTNFPQDIPSAIFLSCILLIGLYLSYLIFVLDGR